LYSTDIISYQFKENDVDRRGSTQKASREENTWDTHMFMTG